MRPILLLLLASLQLLHAGKIASIPQLISENTTIAPGQPFTLALQLTHPPDWHSYYKNPGGIELPLHITWTLPPGATAGEIQWPTPAVKPGYSGKSFIYPGAPTFLIQITPPTTLTPGATFPLTATATWQICKTSCISETATLSLTLPITQKSTLNRQSTALFTTARSLIPQPAPAQLSLTASSTSPKTLTLSIAGLPTPPTEFIPDQPYLKALSDGGEILTSASATHLTLQRNLTDLLDTPIPQGPTASGILIAGKAYLIPPTTAPTTSPTPPKNQTFLTILWGMFLGGLLLNLMPCVFPVIGLKIMGFVRQAGTSRSSIALHGASFAAGVFTSFAVLSTILFTLRNIIGWGFQLQNPYVVLTLLLLMFLLALNMFGLFEMGTSATSLGGNLQQKPGHLGSFLSGILATVVATPCSAPFLGAAIGAVMVLPALQFFTAFSLMATGLALPYLILSLLPHLISRLPRPGPWMESFKQAMSFLLFATAAYLLWIYSALIGSENLLSTLLGLTLIAAAAWIYGRWNLPHRPTSTRAIALILSLSLATTGTALALPPQPQPQAAQISWQPWSQETTDRLLAAGTPVFIDFTARWCLTCQVNKKVAYTPEVTALAQQKSIAFLRADKTLPTPAIDAQLRALGRTAIPVNVLLIPGQEPIITPELLTPAILKKLFRSIP